MKELSRVRAVAAVAVLERGIPVGYNPSVSVWTPAVPREVPQTKGSRLANAPEQLELLRRAQAGDKAAFERLISPHMNRFYGLAYQMMGNAEDAADVTQDAMIKAYRALGSYRGDSEIFAWIARIIRNTALDELKRAVRKHEDPVDVIPETPVHTLERRAEESELQQLMGEAIDGLSTKLRDPLVMYDIEGYSYEEIAGILDINIGTVKSRLNRARESLKTKLFAMRHKLSGYLSGETI
ncbi:ECF RNA polymerase sigma-E factor [compost metagenome]